MRIIFCNVAYLRYYDGREAGELKPKTGGRWVRENEDAHEKWNFLNMDDMCYGFVQGNGEQFHIEKLEGIDKWQDEAGDVTVIWCASVSENKTVVVGWYEHANAYRYLQTLFATPFTGIQRGFLFSTNAENAYLLPESERTFEIGRASKTGAGTGFGQHNYWFAESPYAQENVIPAVMKFIEEHRDVRINTLPCELNEPANIEPLSEAELNHMADLSEDNYKEYLPYAYRMFASEPSADNAHAVAATLSNLYQYKKSIPWFEKVLELDPEDWRTLAHLAYVYGQCEENEKFAQAAMRLLEFKDVYSDPARKDEVYSMLADAHFFKGDDDAAFYWLNKILEESKDQHLIEHTKNTMKAWKEMI